jgi:general secretion pathway protein H
VQLGSQQRRRQRRHDSGFSLIEVLMVIAIFAMVAGAVTVSIQEVFANGVRQAAGKMAGALRFAWDRAAMTGRVVRLAIDLDHSVYWLEIEPEQPLSVQQKFLLAKNKEAHQKVEHDGGTSTISHAGEGRKPESLLGTGSLLTGATSLDASKLKPGAQQTAAALKTFLGGGSQAPAPPNFTRLQQTKNGVIKLPTRVTFDLVYTPHQQRPYASGKAFIYFFPNGQSERAVVQLTDRGGRRFWLWVHPLTGRVQIEPGVAKLDFADFEKRDDEGNANETAPQ